MQKIICIYYVWYTITVIQCGFLLINDGQQRKPFWEGNGKVISSCDIILLE